MGKITISVDDATESLMHEQGGNDVGRYVAELVHQDTNRKLAEAELGRMLNEAEAGGFSERTPHQIMTDVKARLRADGRL